MQKYIYLPKLKRKTQLKLQILMVLNVLGKRYSTCIMLAIFIITELGRHQPQPLLIQMADTKSQGGALAFPTLGSLVTQNDK